MAGKHVSSNHFDKCGSVSIGWEQEKTVGPLAILPKKIKMGFLAPPRVKQGVPPVPSLSKDKKPMPHSSLWKNGVSAEMGLYYRKNYMLQSLSKGIFGSRGRTSL